MPLQDKKEDGRNECANSRHADVKDSLCEIRRLVCFGHFLSMLPRLFPATEPKLPRMDRLGLFLDVERRDIGDHVLDRLFVGQEVRHSAHHHRIGVLGIPTTNARFELFE